jgi:hypothetical protein
MESGARFFEQLNYFWKNMFTKTNVRVLAYCKTCLEHDKEVSLESRLVLLKRETREEKSGYEKLPEARAHYNHTISCREGHEFYTADYWTKWKRVMPPPPFPG